MQTPHGNYAFATKGHGVLLTSYLAPVKDMQTDSASFDEVSKELCRHTPSPNALSTMCLLEITKNPQIITKFYGEPAKGLVTCQKVVFNQCAMMQASKKKDKVQVHFCKLGGTPIIIPADKDKDYTIVVRSKSVSHYVTRVGMMYKMMLHMDDCSLYTIYQTLHMDDCSLYTIYQGLVAAASTSTTTRQAAACLPTRPTLLASRLSETPVSKPRTAAERNIEAETGACTGTAYLMTRKKAAAKNAFKWASSKPQPCRRNSERRRRNRNPPPRKGSLHPRRRVCHRVNHPQEHPSQYHFHGSHHLNPSEVVQDCAQTDDNEWRSQKQWPYQWKSCWS